MLTCSIKAASHFLILIIISCGIEARATNDILTKAERAWLNENIKQLVFSPAPDNPPIEWIDKDGSYLGLSADYIKEIEKILGLKFTLSTEANWSDIVHKAEKGKIHLLPGVIHKLEEKHHLLYTSPYLEIPEIIVARNTIQQENVSRRSTVAIAKETFVDSNAENINTIDKNLKALYHDHKIEMIDTVEGLSKVAFGEVDRFIGNAVTITHTAYKEGISNLRVLDRTEQIFSVSMATSQNVPILRQILSKALRHIPKARKQEINRKWLGLNELQPQKQDWKTSLTITCLFGVLIYILILFKKQASQVKLLKNRLELADYTQSKFLTNISHEVRTPLNAIHNLTKHLISSSNDKAQKEHLDVINKASTHLLTIVEDILSLAKIDSGELFLRNDHINFFHTVKSVVESFCVSNEKKDLSIKLTTMQDMEECVVTDEKYFYQILFNLISNAVKFTSSGSITISVRQSSLEEGILPTTIHVSDTGIGIKEEEIEEIFRKFNQLDDRATRNYEGTGIGLTISKALTQLMGGELSVTSLPGKGSTFSVTIPFKPGDPMLIKKQESSNKIAQFTSKLHDLSILMAEDNDVNYDVAQLYFAKAGVHLDRAENGSQALQYLRSQNYDILLLDLEMPIMGGIEACKRIRNGEAGESNKDIPIIALTAHTSKQHQEASLAAGMQHHVSKPVDFYQLFTLIIETCYHISFRKMAERLECKPQELRALHKKFFQEIPKIETTLANYIRNKEWENIRRFAHRYQGSTSVLGFYNVAQELKKLEHFAPKEDVEAIEQSYMKLVSKLHALKPLPTLVEMEY